MLSGSWYRFRVLQRRSFGNRTGGQLPRDFAEAPSPFHLWNVRAHVCLGGPNVHQCNPFLYLNSSLLKMCHLQGGVYLFQLMDFYSASGMSLLWVCFFQTIAIGWFFGARRFCDCVEQMTGHRPGMFWYLCWKYFAPAVMLVRTRQITSFFRVDTWLEQLEGLERSGFFKSFSIFCSFLTNYFFLNNSAKMQSKCS